MMPFMNDGSVVSVSAVSVCSFAGSFSTAVGAEKNAAPEPRPNVVLIFADDLGYGDLGCFGSPNLKTPHLDRMAAEGRRFTSFYAAQAVCSASRAALLTGCYPNRIGIAGALGPQARHGINEAETTIAEILKARDMPPQRSANGIWGITEFLPTRHGFDEYFGSLFQRHVAEPPHLR
jgi:arylsulfatase